MEARCACGKVHRSDFPEGVTATTQYGPRVQATVVYLTQHHMLPILRTTRILRDTCGVTLSPGTVVRMIHTAAGNLAPTVARIADAVREAHVAHFDETGVRVAGKLHWLHTAATPNMAWVGMHTRRGQEALDAFGKPYSVWQIVPNGRGYRELFEMAEGHRTVPSVDSIEHTNHSIIEYHE
ncbi:IS66 family transposase [Acidithiobacillus ferrianus]|uniref:IS66 family transposase n=1 Tax=Acidithiobacillus ferrianus TaxID=2678518 RepID=UPI0034E50BFE